MVAVKKGSAAAIVLPVVHCCRYSRPSRTQHRPQLSPGSPSPRWS